MARFVAWNILHGGSSKRLPRIALEIVSHAPDVVVISEYKPMVGGQVLAVLADRGLVHVMEAEEAEAGRVRNRTIVVSRYPLSPVAGALEEDLPACLKRRVVVCRVACGVGCGIERGVVLTGAHLPDDWTPSRALQGWAWLAEHSIRLRDERHVILGDLNGSRDRGQPGGAPGHVAHAMGRLWTAGYRDAFGDLAGGTDAAFKRETTWKSNWGHELRLDHAIVSAALVANVAGAKYSHSPRAEGVSDHSAVVLDLSLDGLTEDGGAEKWGKNHEKTVVEPMCRPCQAASGAIKSGGSRRESTIFME
jgi:endonuclease/exonuclease/phosphatase family metal-dependent hydrolase